MPTHGPGLTVVRAAHAAAQARRNQAAALWLPTVGATATVGVRHCPGSIWWRRSCVIA